MSVFPYDPTRRPGTPNPAAPPADLPTAAQHARYADDGAGLLDDALKSSRLRDAFKAGRITDAQARRVVERLIAVGRLDVREATRRLVDGLRSGLATLGGWYRSMVARVVPLHYAAASALLKSGQLPPADLAAVRAASDGQVGFLARFRRNLASGLQRLDGTAVSRAEMYADAAWSVSHNVKLAEATRDGFTRARRVLHAAEHCDDCLRAAAAGWVAIGEVVPLGRSACRTRCRCTIETR